ncbi:MAG: xanthine dehydrogenase [Rhodomicrobium sp.]|nr:xanthine dehydrogenase [Rhodomicrobium sp.]
MIDTSFTRRLKGSNRLLTLVLGTNEIASAVAIALYRDGYGVVLSHDPDPPVIRRGMALHDALFGDPAEVDGFTAVCAERVIEAKREVLANRRIVVTPLWLCDLLVMGDIGILIDARMQKRCVMPDYRNLARLTIGLGPGFVVGGNCDLAIETRPARAGAIIEAGPADAPDGIARKLGQAGAERFVYSNSSGRWRTALVVGQRIFKGYPLGHLGSSILAAPMDGILRGIARDDTVVPGNAKLIEIDPRGRKARWTGIDTRGRAIAKSTLEAVRSRSMDAPGKASRFVHTN